VEPGCTQRDTYGVPCRQLLPGGHGSASGVPRRDVLPSREQQQHPVPGRPLLSCQQRGTCGLSCWLLLPSWRCVGSGMPCRQLLPSGCASSPYSMHSRVLLSGKKRRAPALPWWKLLPGQQCGAGGMPSWHLLSVGCFNTLPMRAGQVVPPSELCATGMPGRLLLCRCGAARCEVPVQQPAGLPGGPQSGRLRCGRHLHMEQCS
jgi:hypothetical protein